MLFYDFMVTIYYTAPFCCTLYINSLQNNNEYLIQIESYYSTMANHYKYIFIVRILYDYDTTQLVFGHYLIYEYDRYSLNFEHNPQKKKFS